MPALFELEVPLPANTHRPVSQISGYLYRTDNQTADKPLEKLVVMMHGWGADSTDLTSLAGYILPAAQRSGQSEKQPVAGIFFPDAPYPCSANPFGREWFALSATSLDADEIKENCAQARWIVHDMADSLLARYGLSASQIVIGGFSQGGMMALAGGLSYHSQLGGLFCLSGGLLSDQINPYQDMPVMLVHGDVDPVVPVAMCHQAHAQLCAHSYSPEMHIMRGLAHGIDQQVIDRLAAFTS